LSAPDYLLKICSAQASDEGYNYNHPDTYVFGGVSGLKDSIPNGKGLGMFIFKQQARIRVLLYDAAG
jgi:hypothetical protein